MAETQQTNKAWYQELGDGIASGVKSWDNFADAMVDTVAPGKSQLDGLISNFSNSNMMSNLLTSNSPVINVKQGLEELCKIIMEWDADASFSDTIKKLWKKFGQFLQKLFQQITAQLIKAVYNAVLKLRRMVISKLNQFLSEYVADACMSGLAEHLKAFANPTNVLSIEEFVSSAKDIMSDVDKNVSDLMEQVRNIVAGTWNFLTGTKYLIASAEHEERLTTYQRDLQIIEMTYMQDLRMAMGDEIAIEEAEAIREAAITALDKSLEEAKDAMVAAGRETLWSGEFWATTLPKGIKKLGELLNDFLCARTSSYVQNADFGLKAGIQNEIKKYMQGCLFQQIIKTSNKVAPGSLTSDVMNRINNLAQNGNMMDAYNVALAAGFDLSGSDFQVQLPSANGWVSAIYGDPYMFSPETPINASQVARFLTDDLPTTSEIVNGDISEDKLEKPYISENWTPDDSATAAVVNKINNTIAMNNAIIDGQENVGRTISYKSYSISTDSSGITSRPDTPINNEVSITKSINRDDFESEFLS